MSTRCNIIIQDFSDRIILYHHCDGYPEGVGADLKRYMSSLKEWQITQYGSWMIANQLVKNKAGLEDETYEISPRLHTDIDYCYVIDCEKATLKCYTCRWLEFDEDSQKYLWSKVFRPECLVDIPETAVDEEL